MDLEGVCSDKAIASCRLAPKSQLFGDMWHLLEPGGLILPSIPQMVLQEGNSLLPHFTVGRKCLLFSSEVWCVVCLVLCLQCAMCYV